MKLRDSISMVALALADIAQSLRVYVQQSTQQRVPPVIDPSAPPKSATLIITDDEELWEKEQNSKLAYLVRATQAELDAAALEQRNLQSAVSSLASQQSKPSDEGQLSDDAKSANLQSSESYDQW